MVGFSLEGLPATVTKSHLEDDVEAWVASNAVAC